MKTNLKKRIVIILFIIIGILMVALITNIIEKKNKKYQIEEISEYKYFVVKEDNKYGVINTKGEKIIECEYEDIKIPNPQKDVFLCYKQENEVEVLNNKREKILTQYENIEPLRLKNISSDLMYEKSTLKYSKNGKIGIINFEGKKLTKAVYEEIETLQFKEGELIVKKNGKYGIINIKGKVLVKPNYDKVEADQYYEYQNGYKNDGYIVGVKTDEGYRYSYVTQNGKEIVETKYNDLYRVADIDSKDIYIICAENGKYGLIKNKQKVIQNEYQSIDYSKSNNTFIVLKGKRYGVISIDGKEIIPTEYKEINIAGDYIYANNGENTEIFNTNGQKADINENVEIINIQNTEYKIHVEANDENTVYSIYKNNQKLNKKDYSYIEYLYNDYFIVSDENGKLGIIDNNDSVKVKIKYDSIQRIENTKLTQVIDSDENITEIYSENMDKICELKNANIINRKEYIKIYNDEEIKYIKDGKEVKNTELFPNNTIFAKKSGNKWGFIDVNGNVVVDYKYQKVTEINEYGYAGIEMNDKWGVVDQEGNVIVNPKYELDDKEHIFIGEYYQVIYGNGEIYYTK